ncbi:MAG: HAD family phosphatase [Ruminococcaceae bacterium]|nr:HAD family phosphatase [Oscillospiraceae bacterium]
MITDKTKPHAIFLDIDGTLAAFAKDIRTIRDDIIPERNKKAIKAAREKGHKVFINTGRGYAALSKAFFEDVKVDGFITALGSYIEVDGKVIFDNPIPKNILDELFDFISENNLPCRFQGKKTLIYYGIERSLEPLWTKVNTKEELHKALGDDDVSKITIDHSLDGKYLELVSKNLHCYVSQKSGEAVIKGCNKAQAMFKVLSHIGIPQERSIAMGDSINDAEILQSAHISIATENASDEVKKMCDMVTVSDIEGGVGKAIEDLLL